MSSHGKLVRKAEDLQEDLSWDSHIKHVLIELEKIYFQRIRPIEVKFDYDMCCPSWFGESMVQKKPFITFLGPFSAGKSTFINYLLQGNLLSTGPQPVTDRFTVISHAKDVQKIPGRVLMADSKQPFRGLNQFGGVFGEVLEGITHPHPILQSVTLIDTPGVLETAGNAHSRRYDYVNACRWFVEKSDLVFVMFDPTKLDSGEELRAVFQQALRGHESKIRIILNKADTVEPQELMRVYGALFWNLSALVATTEPPRVFISSFWEQPYRMGTDHELFTEEKADLIYHITTVVPMQALDRRVASVLQRATRVIAFAILCATYKTKMPSLFGKAKARKQFIEDLPQICEDLANKYRCSVADFPKKEVLENFFSRAKTSDFFDMNQLLKRKWIELMRITVDRDLPMLLKPLEESAVVDPNDRKHALLLQREYFKRMSMEAHGQLFVEDVCQNLGTVPMIQSQFTDRPAICDVPANNTSMQLQSTAPPNGAGGNVNQEQLAVMMQMMQTMMAAQQGQKPSPQQQGVPLISQQPYAPQQVQPEQGEPLFPPSQQISTTTQQMNPYQQMQTMDTLQQGVPQFPPSQVCIEMPQSNPYQQGQPTFMPYGGFPSDPQGQGLPQNPQQQGQLFP